MPTTAGSNALRNTFAGTYSYIVKKLRDAGAVILAKANLSEWANFRAMVSSSGWSAVGGQTKNPYVLDRNPCGSSSGSGVAVSANLCMAAIGTETDGSIVCPSNNNGIVGIKPTVGLLSRTGIIPISYTQDTPGPMCRSVEDAAIGLIKNSGGYSDRVDTLIVRAAREMVAAGALIIEVEAPLRREYADAEFQVLLYEFKDGRQLFTRSSRRLSQHNRSNGIYWQFTCWYILYRNRME